MNSILGWCSNKENIKVLLVGGLAVILIIIVKIQFFGGAEINQPLPSSSSYTNITTSHLQDSEHDKDEITYNVSHIKSLPGSAQIQPPSSISRDIFSPGNHANKTEKTIPPSKKTRERKLARSLALKGTIMDNQGSLAIINDETLAIGESIKGFVVTAIDDNKVIVSLNGRQTTLRIKEK